MNRNVQQRGSRLFKGGIYSKDLGIEVAPPSTEGVPRDKAIIYVTERFYCADYGCVEEGEGFKEYQTVQTPKSMHWKSDLGRVAEYLMEDGRMPIFKEGLLALTKKQREYLCSLLECLKS